MAADFQSYAIFFFIFFISTILLRTTFNSRARSRPRLPPSPQALPILGHLHLLGPLPHRTFHHLSTRFGPLLHLRLGSIPIVVASSAEHAQQILKTHELSFASRPDSSAVRHVVYGSAAFIFASYGPYWKFMKKLCVSELLCGRTLDQMLPIRRGELQRFLHLLLVKSKLGQPANVGAELITMANNVVSRMLMSQSCSKDGEGEDRVQALVREVSALMGKFNVADFIGVCKNLDLQGLKKRYRQVHERFERMMERIIEQRLEKMKKDRDDGDHGDAKDLLEMLLEIYQDENAEFKLTRENIKAFVLDVMVAGTDTTAMTIEWALAELLNHPTVFKRAREEIDSVVGKERLVEESDIRNLPYIQAIIKETLRLHPTGLILRKSDRDTEIGGYTIPANTQVFINVWAIGRDPSSWESPLEFKPERFTAQEQKTNSTSSSHELVLDLRGQHFQLLPFGSGRRGCPGTSLALHLVQTSVAALVQCFDWRVGDGQAPAHVDMTEGSGLTLPKAQPLVCFPLPRLSQPLYALH